MEAKKRKLTVLPLFAEGLIERYFSHKKHQTIIRWALFFTLTALGLTLLLTVTKADGIMAGLAGFFGYKGTDTATIFGEVLNGSGARGTLGKCFDTEVIHSITTIGIVSAIITVASILGLAMVLLYAGVAIVDMTQNGELTKEHLLKILITFAVPTLLIINYSTVHGWMQELGTTIKDDLIKIVDSQPEDGGILQSYTEYDNPFKQYPESERMVNDMIEQNRQKELNGEAPATIADIHIANVIGQFVVGTDYEDQETKSYWQIYAENIENHVQAQEEAEGFWEGVGATLGTALSFVTGFFTSGAEEMRQFFNGAVTWLLQFIIIVIDIFIRIGIIVGAFGVLGRLAIYQAFIPLGVADIGKEGTKGNGMKLIKSYVAVYLEIGMLFIINFIGWQIFQLLVLKMTTLAELIVVFIGAGAGIRAMMKGAKSLSASIMGVR